MIHEGTQSRELPDPRNFCKTAFQIEERSVLSEQIRTSTNRFSINLSCEDEKARLIKKAKAYNLVDKEYSGPVTDEICNSFFHLALSPILSKILLRGKKPADDDSVKDSERPSPDTSNANTKQWHEIGKTVKYERLAQARSILMQAFKTISLILNVNGGDDGVDGGMRHAVNLALESMSSRRNRQHLGFRFDYHLFPAKWIQKVTKIQIRSLQNEYRYGRIHEWGKVAQLLTAEKYKKMASCRCFLPGSIPSWSWVKKALESVRRRFSTITTLYRTPMLGIQFDLLELIKAQVITAFIEYPR